MPDQSSSGFVLPPISLADLQEPTLGRLNRNLQLLAQQLAKIQGAEGRSVFPELQAVDAFATNTLVPTDPTALLTLAAARILFGPKKQTSSGGGGTPGPPGPAGATGPSGGTAIVEDHVLAAATTTTITPANPTSAGDGLTVFVQAKGFTALLAWGTNTRWAPTELDAAVDTWTPFEFRARVDPNDATLKWFCIGPAAIGGMST